MGRGNPGVLKQHLIDDLHRAHKLWSIRTALFWGAVCGLYAAWPAFQGAIPAPVFAGASVLMCMSIAGARVLKQPGAES